MHRDDAAEDEILGSLCGLPCKAARASQSFPVFFLPANLALSCRHCRLAGIMLKIIGYKGGGRSADSPIVEYVVDGDERERLTTMGRWDG